jgi:negative regulator of flagellin synthesis FlgM
METKKIGSNGVGAADAFRTQQSDKVDAKNGAAKSAGLVQPASSETYDVNLSPRARELLDARKKATEIAKNSPDIRNERVAELKRRIQSGEYKVEPEKVADGLMHEAMRDEVATRMHEEATKR